MSWIGRRLGLERKAFDENAAGGPALRSLNADRMFGSINLAKIAEPPKTDDNRIHLASVHPVAFLCIRKISWSVASVPWKITVGGQTIDYEHPFVQRINQPDPSRSKWETYQLVAASLAVTGNAYMLIVPSVLAGGAENSNGKDKGEPPVLVFLRPDRVKPYINPATNRIEYYDYFNTGESAFRRVYPDSMIHIKHSWLHSDHLGFSVLTPAHEPISLYATLSSLARRVAGNMGGMPGMIVFSKRDGLSTTQRDEIKHYISEFKSDGDKFGDIMMLDVADGDAKWVPLAGDLSKIQPKEVRSDAARETANMFGVPPLLLSQGEGATFSNLTEANKQFWLDTIVPGYLTPIGNALSQALGATIEPDLSEVPALSKLNVNTVQIVQGTRGILTINEARDLFGYKPVPFGDRLLQPLGQQPLDTQVVTSDAAAASMYDPRLLQAIIDASAVDAGGTPAQKQALKSMAEAARLLLK